MRHVITAVSGSTAVLDLANANFPPFSEPRTHRNETMFRKRPPTNLGTPGSNPDPGRCECVQHFPRDRLSDGLQAKRQRVADGVKVFLDVAGASSDAFPPLKSALGFVNALIKHHEVVAGWVVVGCD